MKSKCQGLSIFDIWYNCTNLWMLGSCTTHAINMLKEMLEKTITMFKSEHPESIAEVGGHHYAAGCLIEKEKETPFIETLKKNLEIEIVKI